MKVDEIIITDHARKRVIERSKSAESAHHKFKREYKKQQLLLQLANIQNKINEIDKEFDINANDKIIRIIEKGRLVTPKNSLRVLLDYNCENTKYFQFENFVAVVIKGEIVKTVMIYDKKKWKPLK